MTPSLTRHCLLALLVLALGAAAGAQELTPLPAMPLDALPPQARDQVERQLAEVRALLSAAQSDRRELAESFGELGKLYYLYGLEGMSRIAWGNAAELSSGDHRWHFYLGVVERIEGDLESARRRFLRVLELRPDDSPTLLLLGQIELDLGRFDTATQHFEAVLDFDQNAEALYGLGRIAVRQKRYPEAVALLERALEGQPEGSVVHHQLGLAFRGLGDLERARQHLARNRGVPVTSGNPLIEELIPLVRGSHFRARAGIEELKSGRPMAAIERLREAAALDPESAWIRYNLAVAFEKAGRVEEAIAALTEALELDPDYSRAHFNLGTLLGQQGDPVGAARHFRRASEIDPQDYPARLELAVALSRSGNNEGALEALRGLVAEVPRLIEAHVSLATLLAQMGRVRESLQVVEEALAMDAVPREKAQLHTLAGRILTAGNAKAAEAHYRQALELAPSSEEARFGIAMLLGRMRRYDDSADEFTRLVETQPSRADYRMGQSMALLLSRDYTAAVEALEAATERFPEDLALMHTLARLLATCPEESLRDGDRSLELARRAFQNEQTLEHAETMAMALAELGRFEEAIDLQRQVVAQREQNGFAVEAANSQRYLRGYLEGQAVREPWTSGG